MLREAILLSGGRLVCSFIESLPVNGVAGASINLMTVLWNNNACLLAHLYLTDSLDSSEKGPESHTQSLLNRNRWRLFREVSSGSVIGGHVLPLSCQVQYSSRVPGPVRATVGLWGLETCAGHWKLVLLRGQSGRDAMSACPPRELIGSPGSGLPRWAEVS